MGPYQLRDHGRRRYNYNSIIAVRNIRWPAATNTFLFAVLIAKFSQIGVRHTKNTITANILAARPHLSLKGTRKIGITRGLRVQQWDVAGAYKSSKLSKHPLYIKNSSPGLLQFYLHATIVMIFLLTCSSLRLQRLFNKIKITYVFV